MTSGSATEYRPFFSVIVTTFNRAQLLKRALASLTAQVEKYWEAIIVDDESTDDTYTQALPFLGKGGKIRYVRKTHSGEAFSKNRGIELSRGRFISFLDSDDEYAPDHLESRRKILELNPAVAFLSGGVRIIGSRQVPDRRDHSKRIDLEDCVIGGTFFIERQTLLSLSGFRDILLGTDADLFERAAKAGIVMLKTTLPTYIYHHEIQDSITNRMAYL